MSYPDNFSLSAFERAWGSSVPAHEQILEGDTQRIRRAIIAAFSAWPLDSKLHQDERRDIITNELNRMDKNMEAYFHYNLGEKTRHLMDYAGICAAIHESERGIVEDMVSDYVFFWKNKMEELCQE